MIQRTEIKELTARLKEPRKFIQVIVGPRQVGKTTMVSQAMELIDIPHLFFSADNIYASDEWLAEKWQSARLMVSFSGQGSREHKTPIILAHRNREHRTLLRR